MLFRYELQKEVTKIVAQCMRKVLQQNSSAETLQNVQFARLEMSRPYFFWIIFEIEHIIICNSRNTNMRLAAAACFQIIENYYTFA